MKFYIASFIGERERTRAIQLRLCELGHEITVDWTSFPGVPMAERNLRAAEVREIAVRDLQGILDADVFILLAGMPDGRAKYAELGAAIMSAVGTGKPRIYVLGEQPADSVFFFHPAVKRVRSLEEVLADVGEQ